MKKGYDDLNRWTPLIHPHLFVLNTQLYVYRSMILLALHVPGPPLPFFFKKKKKKKRKKKKKKKRRKEEEKKNILLPCFIFALNTNNTVRKHLSY